MEVKGHLGSPEVKRSKPCKRDISRWEPWINFILCMYMCYGKRKNSIIFGGGQRSSGFSGGQTLKTLLTRYLKNKNCKFSNLVHRCPILRGRTLLFLMGVKGHLGSQGVRP
ncbi:hypothetical protein HOLleu_16188 [Holothuria leucospilota]|uniref:Uncharacterized protein n=1 Tax=Holothuria leucospilota TaxID=206669 RepID=A0A9Q1C5T6_HOLLE|nr:hypothetical protein HOLleu_16188 [Holothuria leucospilota]